MSEKWTPVAKLTESERHLITDLYEALHDAAAQLEGFLEGEETHPVWKTVEAANAALARARGDADG